MDRMQQIFLGGVSLAVIAAVGIGLYLNGAPWELRLHRLDEQKVQDLRNLATAVDNYHERNGDLPANLDALDGSDLWMILRKEDPETNTPYDYEVADARSYDLCAVFHRAGDGAQYDIALPDFWKHPAGEHCFRFDATDAGIP
jgi:hypothetical protein